MASKRIGNYTVKIDGVSVIAFASIVGAKEGEGPLGANFDKIIADDIFGQDSWEQAEQCLFREAIELCIQKSIFSKDDVHYLLGGDLLNQIISASFAARSLALPFLGLYGACSTMAESLSLGAMLVDGGYADTVVCATSSHFGSAERQYRFPLEHGNQRTPTAQWTVTGAGATMLHNAEGGARVTHVTTGRVIDLGVSDVNNMGAAMAPAAADTLQRHLADTNRSVCDYDLIITGDLGIVGYDLMVKLMAQKGVDVPRERYMDCGVEIFSPEQDAHAGGSGCGCSASVLNSLIFKKLFNGTLNRVLFMATGALLSPTTTLQGESIPCVAHAVALESGGIA